MMMVSHHPPETGKKPVSAKTARQDKKTQVFIAVFDATEAPPEPETLKSKEEAEQQCTACKEKEVVPLD